ncbi:hypothetical protein ABPG75_000427 [Micractinium tetrahymenae]
MGQAKQARDRPGCVRLLRAVRDWCAGFSFEAWCLALQTSLALALAMLFAVIEPLWLALDQSAVWIVVTTAVVLEPTLGATLKKTALRVAGTVLAGVAGLCILYLAGAGAGGFNYTLHPTAMAAVVTAFTAAAGAACMLLKLRYGAADYCFTVVLITIPVVVVPALRSTDGVEVDTTFKRMAAILIGVGIAAAVQTLVLPVLGRRQLAQRMAGALREAALLLVELVGLLAGGADLDGDLELWQLELGTGCDPHAALHSKLGAEEWCAAEAGQGRQQGGWPSGRSPSLAAPAQPPAAAETGAAAAVPAPAASRHAVPARLQLAGDSALDQLGARLEQRQLMERCCRLDSQVAGLEKMLPLAALELRLLARPHRFPAALFSQLRQCLAVIAGLQVNMAATLKAAAELEVGQLAAQTSMDGGSSTGKEGGSGGSGAGRSGDTSECAHAAADGQGSAASERYRNWNEALEEVQVGRLQRTKPFMSARWHSLLLLPGLSWVLCSSTVLLLPVCWGIEQTSPLCHLPVAACSTCCC